MKSPPLWTYLMKTCLRGEGGGGGQTTVHKRPPSQNVKNIGSQSLILEPSINDYLPYATATTFSTDSFRIVYYFQSPVSDHLTHGLTKQ